MKEKIKKNDFTSQGNSSYNLDHSGTKNYLEEEENYKNERHSNNSLRKNFNLKNNSDLTNTSNFALKDPKYEVKTTAKNENSYKRKFPKVNPKTHHRSNSHNVLF